jgi:hypothetical protein
MSKKICGQVAWCMLLFPITYDVASVAVEPEMSNVIYSTNKQLCELFLLQKTVLSEPINDSFSGFVVLHGGFNFN